MHARARASHHINCIAAAAALACVRLARLIKNQSTFTVCLSGGDGGGGGDDGVVRENSTTDRPSLEVVKVRFMRTHLDCGVQQRRRPATSSGDAAAVQRAPQGHYHYCAVCCVRVQLDACACLCLPCVCCACTECFGFACKCFRRGCPARPPGTTVYGYRRCWHTCRSSSNPVVRVAG